jgi:hypothetical protein
MRDGQVDRGDDPRGCIDPHRRAAADGGRRAGACAAASSTVDGPFAETKEVVGGFAILEASSLKEAIEQTKRFLRVHGEEWNIDCEVRQMEGPDFGAEA